MTDLQTSSSPPLPYDFMPEAEPHRPSERIAQFRSNAEAVQAVVREAADPQAICDHVVALTLAQAGRTIAVVGFNGELVTLLKATAAPHGITILEGPLQDDPMGIHTALTPAQWGIAATGTLVLQSRSEDLRIATMLCESHVCVLDATTIRAELEDLVEVLDATLKEDAAYLAFITGPSRTADIERVLSIGVHGPQHLHILITAGAE